MVQRGLDEIAVEMRHERDRRMRALRAETFATVLPLLAIGVAVLLLVGLAVTTVLPHAQALLTHLESELNP